MTAQKSEGIIGYWFASEPVLPNGDGRAVVIGETLTVDLPLEMCRRGLHGSEHPFDALQYATGPLLYRCRFSGEILREDDKFCASERTALAMVDLTPQLRLFAREQALSVIHLWDASVVVRRYLETGEESLRDAAETAAEAAGRAAEATAYDAWIATGFVAAYAAAATYAAARVAAAAAAAAAAAVRAADSARVAAEDAAENAAENARTAARAAFMRIVEDAFTGHDLP